MASIFAEKRPETSSRAFINQSDGKNGQTMPAVPALQKKGGLDEEEPVMKKSAQLQTDTVQKADGPEEELPAQGKFTVQKAGGPEEELPAQGKFTVQKVGGPEELPAQGKFTAQKVGGPEEELPAQGKFTVQKKSPDENNTGLPDNLKSGVEQLSGHSLADVKVHYNSSQPAQLNALAYAQGTDIHVAPGQEKHLPHEAWHVAQQKQGRVQPTTQAKGVPVNDDKGLESEADTMGAKALQMVKNNTAIAQLETELKA